MGNEASVATDVAIHERTTGGGKGGSSNKDSSGAKDISKLSSPGNDLKKLDSNKTSSTADMTTTTTTPARDKSNSDERKNAKGSKVSARSSRAVSMKQEESISVNLPMTELMAYLQVVASNSSNLPNTRRDDPELGRMVSSLISDEYEAKSSAFIPSDIKILAGSFTRYGKVWDLPTSEEYTPIDGAQEPGCSYGGACTNSFLKAMYDSENSSEKYKGRPDTSADEPPLFPPTESQSMPSLDLDELAMPGSMSWAELLQKMKVEMQQTGFCQLPQLVSSMRVDLTQPVTLVPPTFDPSINKKRSLLIGCNYSDYGKGAELKGSHDDINSMQDYIVNIHGFPQHKEYMTVLLDDGKKKPPSYKNISDAFKHLSEVSKPGDVVFVHYSGHGCRVLDSPIDSGVDAYDEGIVPSDFGKEGIIRDTLIFKTLIAPMRKGVTVTCIFDACDTGIMVDLPFSWQPAEKNDEVAENNTLVSRVNADFSFVRFLKVIKTLYESSTFTQLGKTVHGVLDEKSPTSVRPYDEYSLESNSYDDGSLETVDKENSKPTGSAFFNALTACRGTETPKLKMNMTDVSDLGSPIVDQKKESISGIFQQMLTCTIPMFDTVDEDQKNDARTHHRGNDNTTLGDASSYGTDFYSDDDMSASSTVRSTRK